MNKLPKNLVLLVFSFAMIFSWGLPGTSVYAEDASLVEIEGRD